MLQTPACKLLRQRRQEQIWTLSKVWKDFILRVVVKFNVVEYSVFNNSDVIQRLAYGKAERQNLYIVVSRATPLWESRRLLGSVQSWKWELSGSSGKFVGDATDVSLRLGVLPVNISAGAWLRRALIALYYTGGWENFLMGIWEKLWWRLEIVGSECKGIGWVTNQIPGLCIRL